MKRVAILLAWWFLIAHGYDDYRMVGPFPTEKFCQAAVDQIQDWSYFNQEPPKILVWKDGALRQGERHQFLRDGTITPGHGCEEVR